MENVVHMPGTLERLASGIKAELAKTKSSREAWVEAWVAVAVQIAQARELLAGDQAFGAWWDEQSFGLDAHCRAALVAMGAHPETMREVLTTTGRNSIRLIYGDSSARFGSAAKPRRTVQRRVDPDANRPVEQQARAIARARMDAGLDVHPRKLETDTGISHVMFDQAIAQERAVDEAKREWVENPPVDPATLPRTAQQKLEAAKRQAMKDADRQLAARQAQVDEEVRQKVLAGTAERLAKLEERQREEIESRDRYNKLTNQFKPIYTVEEWEVLRRVCHPDNSAGEALRARAFDLINRKKLQLTGQK